MYKQKQIYRKRNYSSGTPLGYNKMRYTKKIMSKMYWRMRKAGANHRKAFNKVGSKAIGLKVKHPYRDDDKDGVVNKWDCQPKNRYKQDDDDIVRYREGQSDLRVSKAMVEPNTEDMMDWKQRKMGAPSSIRKHNEGAQKMHESWSKMTEKEKKIADPERYQDLVDMGIY